MNVLIVVHGFPPRAQGGSELYAEAHARRLRDRHGDAVLVLTREQDPARPEFDVRHETRGGLQIVWINNTFATTRSFDATYRNATIESIARREVDRFAPDVAHVHHLTCLSSTIVHGLHARGVPVVLTLHDYWLMCHRGQLLDVDMAACSVPGGDGCGACAGPAGSAPGAVHGVAAAFRAAERRVPASVSAPVRRVAERAAAGLASALNGRRAEFDRAVHMRDVCSRVSRILAPSVHMRLAFERFGVDPSRIADWAYGVDNAGRPAPAPPAASTDGVLRLVYAGSLMASKAPHLAVDAIGRLPDNAATLDLFGGVESYHGDDSYRAVIESRRGRPGIRFHGRQSRDEVSEALRISDALVVPSVWPENSPFVIHEALAAGVPVVASRIGGIPELVRHGENGLLFEAGDLDDLTRQLERLSTEPDLLAALRLGAEAGRSLDDDVAATRALYGELIDAAPPRPAESAHAAVVLNYETADETLMTVRFLLASRTDPGTVIVVDNSEKEPCRSVLEPVADRVHLIEMGRNTGFPRGMNAGVGEALARGASRVLLVNSDVTVPPDCLAALNETLDTFPHAGVVGPVVMARSAPDTVATRGMRYDPRTGRMRHLGAGDRLAVDARLPDTRVAAVSGCLMLVRREVFEAVGDLAEEFFFSFEDLDFCLRARAAGFESVVSGRARAYHEGGRSMGARSPRRLYFAARNHLLAGRRAAPGTGRLAGFARSGSIVGFNLLHALRAPGATLPVRVAAVVRGSVDYARGRFGPADPDAPL